MTRSLTQKDVVSLSDEDKFRNTCIELIKLNFPSTVFPESGLPINALSVNEDIIFKIISEESIPAVVQLINDDLSVLKKCKSKAAEIYYFSKSKSFENVFYLKRIQSSIQKNKLKINLLSYSEISKMLLDKKSYSIPPQFVAENISLLFEKFFPAHNRFPSVFEEIVSFVYHQNLTPINPKKANEAFLKLKIKIPVNFASEDDREKVFESFNKYWQYKERVRHYLELNINTDPFRILSLLFKIQNEFKQLNAKHDINHPVNFPSIFLSIANSLVPTGKTNIPEYESVALAIVYYFFEMCDYGQRFAEEQLSLYQEKMKEYGPPQ